MSRKSHARPVAATPPVRPPRETNAGQSLRGQTRLPSLPNPNAASPFLLKSNARFKSLGIGNTDTNA